MSEPWVYQALCWVLSLIWQTGQTQSLTSLKLTFNMGNRDMNEQFQYSVRKCFDRGNSAAIGLHGRTENLDCESHGRMYKSLSG